jgi:class 3 adenylate cyclase
VPNHYHELLPPVTDVVTIAFTDVEMSTELWEAHPEIMQEALKIHNVVIRKEIALHRGYEVKTEGDAFMVAFEDAHAAVKWALAVEMALARADWPAELAIGPSQKLPQSLGLVGLRVRIGLHTDSAHHEASPVTGRMDYFGRAVNKTARISALAAGGQVAISDNTYTAVFGKDGDQWDDGEPPFLLMKGDYQLKGVAGHTRVYLMLSVEHEDRKSIPFATYDKSGNLVQTLQTQNEVLKRQLATARWAIGTTKAGVVSHLKHLRQHLPEASESQIKLALKKGETAVAAHTNSEGRTQPPTSTEDIANKPNPTEMLERALRDSLTKIGDLENEVRDRNSAQKEVEGELANAKKALAQVAAAPDQSDTLACEKPRAVLQRQLKRIESNLDKYELLVEAIATPSDAQLLGQVQKKFSLKSLSALGLKTLADDSIAEVIGENSALLTARRSLAHVHTVESGDELCGASLKLETTLVSLARKLGGRVDDAPQSVHAHEAARPPADDEQTHSARGRAQWGEEVMAMHSQLREQQVKTQFSARRRTSAGPTQSQNDDEGEGGSEQEGGVVDG